MAGFFLQRHRQAYALGVCLGEIVSVIGEGVARISFLQDTCTFSVTYNFSCTTCPAHSFSPSLGFSPGTAMLPNIAKAWLTLSRRTVLLPCSRSRIKRKPNPDRSANSGWVNPALFRSVCIYVPIGLFICLAIAYAASLGRKRIFPSPRSVMGLACACAVYPRKRVLFSA